MAYFFSEATVATPVYQTGGTRLQSTWLNPSQDNELQVNNASFA